MKEKILAQLRVKFPGVSKELLGRIADKLTAKVTAEDQIQGAIGELDNHPLSITDYAAFLQAEGDRRVTDAQRTWQQEQQAAGDEDEEPDDPKPTKPAVKGKKDKGGDDPISKLTTVVTQLANTVANMQKEGNQKTLTEQLHLKLGDKKIPVTFAKGRTVEKLEDLETVFAEIESDFTAVKQDLINQGLGGNSLPAGGGGRDVGKTKVEADIGAWAQKNSPSNSQSEKK